MTLELALRIVLEKPLSNVDYGLQKGNGSNYETVQTKRSNSQDLRFNLEVKIKNSREKESIPNFTGSYVQGASTEKFIYIDIGTCAGQANTIWSRRLKIPLTGITWDIVEQVTANPNMILETHVAGIGKDGGPNCATVKPFDGWKINFL